MDELSHRGSESSLNFNHTLPRMSTESKTISESTSTFPPAKPPRTASFTQEKKSDFDFSRTTKPLKGVEI